MTQEEKITYMRIATNLCKFGFETKHVDLLLCLYEAVVDRKGDLTMRETAKIEADIIEKYKPKPPKMPVTTNDPQP